MARILPGVEIRVVKEIVSPAVTPSGVLGLAGITDRGPVGQPVPVSSWPSFLEKFGGASAFTMPEAKQAIMNGIFELVVVRVDDAGQNKAKITLQNSTADAIAVLEARAKGAWANKLGITVKQNKNSGGTPVNIDLAITCGAVKENFPGLVMDPGSNKYLFDVINRDSDLVTAIDPVYTKSLPADTTTKVPFVDYVSTTPAEKAAHLYLPATAAGTDHVIKLEAKAAGDDGNALKLKARVKEDTTAGTVDLIIYKGTQTVETYSAMTMDPDSDNYLVFAVNNNAKSLIKALDLPAPPPAGGDIWPVEGLMEVATADQGTDPPETAYKDAIDALEAVPSVDLVAAALPAAFYTTTAAAGVHAHINAHCIKMSDEAKNRIGLGTVAETENGNTGAIGDRAVSLFSDRFVLIAPRGVLGAVAGRIGSLRYFESPTFKTISGIASLEYAYKPSQLRSLLKANVLALEVQRGRGMIMEKGISTSGEQISVTRVADYAVRGVKGISDLFIGTLNTEEGRMALKQKITEFFLGMEKEGAIVPSPDSDDPSFKVEVYSSTQDFGQGIVRVDIAVRPVRAIDYIYATIKVEV